MSEETLELNCHNLGEMADMADRLHEEFMCAFDHAGIAPIAEQHYLRGMDAIKAAASHFRIAHYEQMQGR